MGLIKTTLTPFRDKTRLGISSGIRFAANKKGGKKCKRYRCKQYCGTQHLSNVMPRKNGQCFISSTPSRNTQEACTRQTRLRTIGPNTWVPYCPWHRLERVYGTLPHPFAPKKEKKKAKIQSSLPPAYGTWTQIKTKGQSCENLG